MKNFFDRLRKVAYIGGVGTLYHHASPWAHIGKELYSANEILCQWASRKAPCPYEDTIIELHEKLIEGIPHHNPSDIWYEVPRWTYQVHGKKETTYLKPFSYFLLTPHHDQPIASIQRLPTPHNRAGIVNSIPKYTWVVELAPEYNWRGDLAINDPTNKVYAETLPPQFTRHQP